MIKYGYAASNHLCRSCFFYSLRSYSCDYYLRTKKKRQYPAKHCKDYLPRKLCIRADNYFHAPVMLIRVSSGKHQRVFDITPLKRGELPKELIDGKLIPLNARLSIKYLQIAERLSEQETAELLTIQNQDSIIDQTGERTAKAMYSEGDV